jgi:hypothetical protein
VRTLAEFTIDELDHRARGWKITKPELPEKSLI